MLIYKRETIEAQKKADSHLPGFRHAVKVALTKDRQELIAFTHRVQSDLNNNFDKASIVEFGNTHNVLVDKFGLTEQSVQYCKEHEIPDYNADYTLVKMATAQLTRTL